MDGTQEQIPGAPPVQSGPSSLATSGPPNGFENGTPIGTRSEYLNSQNNGGSGPSDVNGAGPSGNVINGGAIGGDGPAYMSSGRHEMGGQSSSQLIQGSPSKQQMLVRPRL